MSAPAPDVKDLCQNDRRYLRGFRCKWCETPVIERRCLSIYPPRCSEQDMVARRAKILRVRGLRPV